MARRKSDPTDFEEDFWKKYPVKKSKKKAKGIWQQMTEDDRRAAVSAIPTYIADCQQHGYNYAYPNTWLNGRRWEDEVSDPTPAPPLQGRGVPCGQTATKRELFRKASGEQAGLLSRAEEKWGAAQQFPTPSTANAQPLPSHPRGGAGVGSETSPIPPVGMEKW